MNKLPQTLSCLSARRWFLAPISSSTQFIRERHNKKLRGLQFKDGDKVTGGTPLVYQKALNYHPGLNVGLARNMILYAIDHGTVKITRELADPDWSQDWIQRFYGHINAKRFYKEYIHVIPEPDTLKFNLIDQN